MSRIFYSMAMLILAFGVVCICQLDIAEKNKFLIILWVIFYGGFMAGSEHYSSRNANT